MNEVPPVLVEVSRNGYVESRHRGSFVVIDASGAVVASAGAVDEPVFPRSSLKPLQALAMVEAGFPGRDGALALACASHSGEAQHIAGVRETLAAAGLDESALQCPPDLPLDQDALLAWVGGGGGRARVCHNCSGKHAAMLATCVAAGWPVSSYRAPDHPLQRAIRSRIAQLCDVPVAGVAVDGCGAPAFAVSLHGLARAFGRIAAAEAGAPALVAAAMRSFPLLVGGHGRAGSELMSAVPGLIAKEGAEAVWGAALPDGRAFAAKLEDGGGRALPPLLGAVARYWALPGTGHEVVQRWSRPPVLGAGAPVGAISASPQLRALLGLPGD